MVYCLYIVAVEVTTLRRYTNLFIIIIVVVVCPYVMAEKKGIP